MGYGIIGDEMGTELPEVELDQTILHEEKKLAKFSRTAEFKRQKEYMEQRIDFYNKYLPGGAEIGVDVHPTAEDWRVANRVIGEFKAFLDQYEIAREEVDNVR